MAPRQSAPPSHTKRELLGLTRANHSGFKPRKAIQRNFFLSPSCDHFYVFSEDKKLVNVNATSVKVLRVRHNKLSCSLISQVWVNGPPDVEFLVVKLPHSKIHFYVQQLISFPQVTSLPNAVVGIVLPVSAVKTLSSADKWNCRCWQRERIIS